MDKFSHHISKQFNEELENVRQLVLQMGGLVESQLEKGVQALVSLDSAIADEVIYNDCKVNALEVQIDEYCVEILARRQPAASDLRLIMAIIKTITDLERIGDEAERIARMSQDIASNPFTKFPKSALESLGNQVRLMLRNALDAYARMDTEAAITTWKSDHKVDELYESIMRQLMTFMMEDPRSIPHVLDTIWAIRALERIGDRTRNICEYIIYFVKGKDIRHTNIDQIHQELGLDE